MKLPHPYIAKYGKVINTETNKVLKVYKNNQYNIKGKWYYHNKIFNIKKEERTGVMIKDDKGVIYISISQAKRQLKISRYKLEKLIDEGQFEVLPNINSNTIYYDRSI